MTIIVGYCDFHTGKVYIGGDSAGTDGHLSQRKRLDKKVFKKKVKVENKEAENMLFGYTSSFRMGQLLRYKLELPTAPEKMEDDEYMTSLFIDSVIKCLKVGGYVAKQDGRISGGTFLVGWRGKLYCIEGDFQVGRRKDKYDAVGCGCDIAIGCMFGLEQYTKLTPEGKIETCLRASSEFSAGCSEPFVIERV
jgi:hypothetical protein